MSECDIQGISTFPAPHRHMQFLFVKAIPILYLDTPRYICVACRTDSRWMGGSPKPLPQVSNNNLWEGANGGKSDSLRLHHAEDCRRSAQTKSRQFFLKH